MAGAVAVLLMAAVPGARAHSIEQANTFGQIIALPGHINDVAVDEVRRLVYAGNVSAGRVEVISMTTNQRITSFPTSPQPSAMSGMAMSLDARFLVAINVPVTSGVPHLSSITAINLNDSTDRHHFSLPDTPLAVTFIAGGDALIVTTWSLLLFDPEDGSTRVLSDLENPPPDVVLPTPLPAFPRELVPASVATSADGKWVYGLSDASLFVYQVFQPTGLLSFRLTDGLVNLLTNAVNILLGGIVHANVVGVDQKGTLYPVPGSCVDVIANPYRDRFYVLDQADFRVLVFDSDFRLTGSFRTGNTPTAMAMTQDGTSLLVANSQSETITWIDLNVFINRSQLFFPWRILGSGHYPRSIATDSPNIMMSAESVAGGVLAFLDMRSRIISVPDTLGIFDNNVDAGAGLAGTPDGRGILIAEPGGGPSVFEAQTSRIILSCNDLPGLSGAVGAGFSEPRQVEIQFE